MSVIGVKRKGKLFAAIAMLVLLFSMAPGVLITQWFYPPRREEDIVSVAATLLWTVGVVGVLGTLLFFVHRAPPEGRTFGETRNAWLALLYTCIVLGVAAGVAFAVYTH